MDNGRVSKTCIYDVHKSDEENMCWQMLGKKASPICICNWQNVLGSHHASAHGGSSDLIVKMLD